MIDRNDLRLLRRYVRMVSEYESGHARLVLAAHDGHGVRLSAESSWRLGMLDDAIQRAAMDAAQTWAAALDPQDGGGR